MLLAVVVVVDIVDDGGEERPLEDARPQQEAALDQLLPRDVPLVLVALVPRVPLVTHSCKVKLSVETFW